MMEEDKVFAELAKAKVKNAELETEEEIASLENPLEEGRLMVDVFEDGDDIIVQSAVAGARDADIDVHITGDSVTIRGKRERTHEVKEKDYLYQECFWGQFSRTVILPEDVNPEKAAATLKNGILTIRMPRASKQKTKKVKVKEN